MVWMRRFVVVAASLVAIVAMSRAIPQVMAAGASKADEKEANKIAEAWLAHVDGKRYGASWDEAAELFKRAVTKDQWTKQVGSARDPLGALRSRKLSSSTPQKSLPGAPDGEYVVMQFETSFEKKATAVETVTAMRDRDGRWHIAGYYIK